MILITQLSAIRRRSLSASRREWRPLQLAGTNTLRGTLDARSSSGKRTSVLDPDLGAFCQRSGSGRGRSKRWPPNLCDSRILAPVTAPASNCSIPAAFGSNTGRSSKHIPLFRLRRLGFASRACRLPPRVFFTGCSLSELQATAKLRHRRYSSKRNQLGCPTVNHCSAHGTWDHANDRRFNNTPLP